MRKRLPALLAGVTACLLVTLSAATADESGARLPSNADWRPTVEAAPMPLAPAPGIEILRAGLGPDDPVAVLEAVQRALDEVADGAAYVWHRQTGPLWGVVRPLMSFRGSGGEPCRRLHLALSLGEHTQATEIVACRAPDRRWWLTG